jgi:putative ABC transport system ATP-binding protein
VGGRRIDRLDEAERTAIRRREIGMVFQSHNLVPTLTAAENVQLPLELNAVVREEAAARAEEQLARLGLGTLCHRYPEELSGGERQRVAVARAIVHRPALVLADEPTGNLDLESARHVVAELESLCRERGVTLVMVTHSLEVAGHADRVLALREGRLVAEEAPSA